MADDLERPAEPAQEESEHQLPTPTILPFAFAAGIALVLVGLIINWWLAVAGGVLARGQAEDALQNGLHQNRVKCNV